MKRIKFIGLLLYLVSFQAKGQDLHFSQFYAAPAHLNPAFTGHFKGDFRFIGNQRTQWRSITEPYRTIGGSVDTQKLIRVSGLGTGFSVYQDRAGDSQLSTLEVNLQASYTLSIPGHSLQELAFGIQTGFTQKKGSYDDLSFDNQYNGFFYDPSLANGENFGTNQLSYLNLNAGVAYFYSPQKGKVFVGGMSLNNIQKPEQSWTGAPGVRLDRRFNIHLQGQLPLPGEFELLPAFSSSIQGPLNEWLVGSRLRYTLYDRIDTKRAVLAGLFYRTKDAGYVYAGLEYHDWTFGLSYDINISDLSAASRGRGGLEISIQYILKTFKPFKTNKNACPIFI